MPISTEVLNTTFRDLKGPLLDTFLRRTPLLETFLKNGRVRKSMDGGTYIERGLMTGSPATGRGIYNGSELLNLVRAKRVENLKIEPHRLAAAIAIPKRELAQNNGQRGVMKLIEKYPESFMKSTDLCIESFFLSGAAPVGNHAFDTSALSGFLSLNGLFTGGTLTGTTNGLLSFAAPSVQAGVDTQSLAKSEAQYYYNQYESISAWSAEGLKLLGKLTRRAGNYSIEGSPSLGFMDPDSMANLEESKRSHVRVQVVNDSQEKGDLNTIDHNGVTYHESLDLDRTLAAYTNTALADGGGYILNPDYFEFAVVEDANMTDFEDRIAAQDVVVAKFAFHAGLICTHIAAQAAFSGSAL